MTTKHPHGLRAGTSLLAIYEWLLEHGPATAQAVGDALHDDVYREHFPHAMPELYGPRVRRDWALRLLRRLRSKFNAATSTSDAPHAVTGTWTAVPR